MFDGFQLDRVDVGDVTLRVRYDGEGEPVVLLPPLPQRPVPRLLLIRAV
jgi:haloacetate dehalogenase